MKRGCASIAAYLVFFAGLPSTLILSSPAIAEDETSGVILEEIVVTARFREETIQDIGASIAALGSDELTNSGITDFEDIARRLAGVNLLDAGAHRNEITIRGVASAMRQSSGVRTSQPLVATYVDDIYISAGGVAVDRDISLFDFNRVEVLRGPQPTLFGKGSVGGVVRYFSQDPSLDGNRPYSGVFNSSYESTEDGGNNFRVEGSVDLTLSPEVLGLRIVGSLREDDGFIDNVALGLDDVNDLESTTWRAVLLYTPSDTLSFRLSATTAEDTIGEFTSVETTLPPDELIAPRLNAYDGEQVDEFELFSGKIVWEPGPVTIESITGYFNRSTDVELFSATFTLGVRAFFLNPALPFHTASNLANGDYTFIELTSHEDDGFSQEFRFISNFEGPLNFTAGLFYQDLETGRELGSYAPGYLEMALPPTDNPISQIASTNSEQLSGFVEFTYELSDRTRFILGARYVDETVETTLIKSDIVNIRAPIFTGRPGSTAPVYFPVPSELDTLRAAGINDPSFEFELGEFLPRIGFEYDLGENSLVYGNLARGLRNGGLNLVLSALAAGDPGTPEFADALTFDEDSAWSYELGIKNTLADGDLTLNLAVFLTDFEDQQITIGVPTNSTTNAPDQDIYGFEVETAYDFSENLSAYFAGAYTKGEYTDSAQTFIVNGAPAGFHDLSEGNSPPITPELSFSTGLELVFPTGWRDIDFVGRLDYQHVDSRYSTAQNFPSTELGELQLLNLRLSLQTERWSLAAYGANLTNDVEFQQLFAPTNGVFFAGGVLDARLSGAFVNRPRTVGVNLQVRF